MKNKLYLNTFSYFRALFFFSNKFILFKCLNNLTEKKDQNICVVLVLSQPSLICRDKKKSFVGWFFQWTLWCYQNSSTIVILTGKNESKIRPLVWRKVPFYSVDEYRQRKTKPGEQKVMTRWYCTFKQGSQHALYSHLRYCTRNVDVPIQYWWSASETESFGSVKLKHLFLTAVDEDETGERLEDIKHWRFKIRWQTEGTVGLVYGEATYITPSGCCLNAA